MEPELDSSFLFAGVSQYTLGSVMEPAYIVDGQHSDSEI